MNNIKKIFKNKKIIVTGHTGFKGSWLTAWLISLGSKVIGVSQKIPTSPSHFETLKLKKKIKHLKCDIRNLKKLKSIFSKTKPDFVFHLAAQALVKNSYKNPLDTIETNAVGTLNVLESLRAVNKKKDCVAVIITSDKVYQNLEINRGYSENDILGGKDPYSSSKASAELIIKSYIESFFKKPFSTVRICIARAGNVIGGGDWSDDRLIPDCVKSWSKYKKVTLRNPYSTRPWQHVLEAVWGYLLLAANAKKSKKFHGQSFNFGPNYHSNYNVLQVVKTMKKYWSQISWQIKKDKKQSFFESNLLKLNSNKAKKFLGWSCKMSFLQTIKMVSEWYQQFYSNKNKSASITYNQIRQYEKIIKIKNKL